MSDNKNLRGSQDRVRVSTTESWELRTLMEKYHVTGEEVQAAVKAVGNNREKVEEYLEKRSSKRER